MRPRDMLRHGELGQSAVIVALLLVALMGMLALTFDGGYTYFQRRLAQTAADAGALAGARQLCVTGDPAFAIEEAEYYATEQNAAHEAEAAVDAGLVQVSTTISFTTAFASVLGQPEMTVVASAEAGCFGPSGATGVLPVAWACKPPEVDLNDNFDETDDCAVVYGPDARYVIMDSGPAATDYYCQNPPNSGTPAGALDCDVDNDGYDDIFAAGNRSWLDLDGGGGGSSELVNWVNGGYSGQINIHSWFGGQPGTANNVFQAAASRIGQNVILPVFDAFCDLPGALPATSCPGLYHADDVTFPGGGAAALYYHVISFSVFHITCVDAPGVSGPPCPGKQAAVAAGAAANIKTIEGYFVEDFDPNLIGKPVDGVYAGAFTLFLTR